MRIRAQFIITMLLFGMLLASISATAMITNQRAGKASEQETIASAIAQGANELSYLANDYVIYREGQQLERWHTRFASFLSDVARLRTEDSKQQALVGNIQANAQRLKDVFESVVSAIGSASQAQDGTLEPALLQVSWSRLVVQSQALVSDASSLSRLLRNQVNLLRRINAIVVIALIGVFVLYFLANDLMMRRRTLKEIAQLQVGAAIVGSGNLDFKIPEKGHDEIGDLSRAFNRMTANLKDVTATKDELEKEIAQRKTAEKQSRLTLESIGDGFFAVDSDWKFVYVNKPAEQILGIRSEEVLGKSHWEVFPLTLGTNLEREYRRAAAGEARDFENFYEPWSRWFHNRCFPREGGGISIYFQDVTERKKAEAEIAYLASFPELNPNPVLEMDDAGNIEYMNLAATEVFPDLAERGNDHPLRANWDLLTGALQIGETPLVKRDFPSGEYWYEETVIYLPSPPRYRFYIRDVTERKKAEQALKESERRWATTLASIGDAVIATDVAGRITFVNAVAEGLTGWTSGEASGKQVTEVFNIISEETRKEVESPVVRALHEGIIVGLANHTILVKRDGTEMPIDDSAAPIRDEEGRVGGVVLIFRDITERRKADQVKDDFIGMVSHELRTPLTVVTGAIHTAMLEGLPHEELPVLLREAALGAESLADILDNLLELSRYQAKRLLLSVETADLRQVVDGVVEPLRSESSTHQLIIDVPEQLPSVKVDKVRLERILNNLIDNAVKYSPQGGEVTISARQHGDFLIVGVADQGIGISPEDQVFLFQPFTRVENRALQGRAKGLGLGLVVCRRLVEAHRGRVWVESTPGKGSTFYFSIPIDG